MVVADKDDSDSGDLLEVHGPILETGHGIVGGLDDQPDSPGKVKGVLTCTVGREGVKAPREGRGDRQNLSGIQIG